MYPKPLRLPKAAILVLEKDPNRRAVLCDLLADAGYTLVDAASDAVCIDLVVADIAMDGAASALRDLRGRAVPVIALADRAAWTGFDFFDAANDLGAVAVLQRPFARTALLQLVAAVLSDAPEDIAAAEADRTAPGDRRPRRDYPYHG